MNKAIIAYLYKIYDIDTNWDGKSVLMNEKKQNSLLFSAENRLFRLNCNTNESFYFNLMHREKSGAIQVEVYNRDFVSYTCPTESNSSYWGGKITNKQYKGGFFNDTYKLDNVYQFSVELTEETTKFLNVGILSTSEITSPVEIDKCRKIFMKGLEEYGFKPETSGGNKRKSSRRKSRRRKYSNT